MERLTKRNEDGSVGISEFRYYNYRDFQKLASKLAEYEDIGTVEEFEKMKILFGNDDIKVSEVVNKILKEYLQYKVIGTIEELKNLKQWKADIIENFCKYDASSFEEIIHNASNKVINDFAEKLMEYCSMSDMNRIMIIQIAEKLKKEV